MSRQALKIIATLLGIFGVCGVSVPFMASLNPSASALNKAEFQVYLNPIIPGQLQRFQILDKPLFIYRPEASQRDSIKKLDTKVRDKSLSSYVKEIDAFVFWGISTRFGCTLNFMPPSKSRLSESDPEAQWLGGFWDPICEVSYDFAGRVIISWPFTYNGFTASYPNLVKPKIKVSGNVLSVYML